MPAKTIQRTYELVRILQIPRRPPPTDDPEGQAFAIELSESLRRPNGLQTLHPVQALALYELVQCGGLFASIGVGQGKTLISLLAAWVLASIRPLLLLPASLVGKTQRALMAAARHWHVPFNLRLASYQMLGRPQHQKYLMGLPGKSYYPTLIIADEAHWLKNKDAAVTQRVGRYMAAHPETVFLALSGTITSKSVKDFAHIMLWCLGPQGTPVPLEWNVLEVVCKFLDARKKDPNGEEIPPELGPGALSMFLPPGTPATMDATPYREAFRSRMAETSGVIMTTSAPIDASLYIDAVEIPEDDAIDGALQHLRNMWETPDGWPLWEGHQLRRHALELILGFYYVWDPRPPSEWLEARKEWSKVCRDILVNNKRDLDSAKPVVDAIDKGLYPHAEPALAAWRAIKDTFTEHVRAEWISDVGLKTCERWLEGGGICFTYHVHFAEELARRTGLQYYGQKGNAANGENIEATKDRAIIASGHANKQGINIQDRFDRALVTGPFSNGEHAEQLLGRLHRQGQDSDQVQYDMIVACREHVRDLDNALSQARFAEQLKGERQKLLFADIAFDIDDFRGRPGPRWRG